MLTEFDIAIVGGGPAGLAAALWAGRYRRSVVVFDEGCPRNRSAVATHGYLGLDGQSPQELLEHARSDVARYPEVLVRSGVAVRSILQDPTGFVVKHDGGPDVRALRIILATGVRDLFPPIERFEEFFGSSVFICASCDGYEAQGKAVAVMGDDVAPFAVGLLDWARSVTVIVNERDDRVASLRRLGVDVVEGEPVRLDGAGGVLRSIQIGTELELECDVLFCNVQHEQRSERPGELGCAIDEDGCVQVDSECETTVAGVFAAGDMTPGPHLVQVAAAQGAIAGIAAATSLRGEEGAPTSPPPAPDAAEVLAPR